MYVSERVRTSIIQSSLCKHLYAHFLVLMWEGTRQVYVQEVTICTRFFLKEFFTKKVDSPPLGVGGGGFSYRVWGCLG
jgi:hypothetical protein